VAKFETERKKWWSIVLEKRVEHCLGEKGAWSIVLEKRVKHCLGERGRALSLRKGWSIV
jgi:hypothetical protein